MHMHRQVADLPLLLANPTSELTTFFTDAIGEHYDVKLEKEPDRAIKAGVATTRYALRIYDKGSSSPRATLRLATMW